MGCTVELCVLCGSNSLWEVVEGFKTKIFFLSVCICANPWLIIGGEEWLDNILIPYNL